MFPQSPVAPVRGQPAGGGIWTDVSEQNVVARLTAVRGVAARHREIVPQKYRTLQIDKGALQKTLASAVLETVGPIDISGIEFQIPHPRGGFHRFLIQESPIMEPKLAAKFPELKTYVGRSLDDPTATVRMDVTPRGFHAVVLSAEGEIYIDPYARESDGDYISYFKQDLASQKPFSCAVETDGAQAAAFAAPATALRSTGGTLKTYRLALACTGEYATAVCNPSASTVSATLAAMITSVNRCDAIYEREFAIRLMLVENTDKLIFLDGTTDPYTNGTGSAMLSQNQSTIDSVIGNANYDIGHVFSTGGGGIAAVAVVCVAGRKASGVTGSTNPVGDPFDVDYFAHEMGHQFGANHPFDGTSGNCAGNGYAATAYEPGSGSTIMAYAGICSGQNLASHSDDYFSTVSYDEIVNCTSSPIGNGCAQQSSTGNTPPNINALSAFTIPAQTPFALSASATDPDGDTLTYCWEELDRGAFQDPTANPRDNGSSPLFRSFPPTTNPIRTFPSLTYILNNQNMPPALIGGYACGEFLPTTSRAMSFRVTVRDNHPGGGGTAYNSTTVTAVSSAGPFAITAPNTSVTIEGGSQQTITWNVANTDISPINCANVKISLSTDGGNTFPIVLASSVPNNGTAIVTIPNIANVATTQGRIKMEAVGNIFFDISDADLTITSSNTAPVLNISSSITVIRGNPTPTVATIGNASDANGNPVTVAVSNVPFGAHITPSISNGSISLSATVDCAVVVGTMMRSYPITVTVTDSNGSTAPAQAILIVTPNPSPTLGVYADSNVAQNSKVSISPLYGASDLNGNLGANSYSVIPANLPGGGTLTINQSSGMVTATATSATTPGTVPVRVTIVDSCGAAAVQTFHINVLVATIPSLQAGAASAPTAEGCSPANGAVDPGETVTVNFSINNNGGTQTTNLVATLQATGGITPITTTQTYGGIGPNSSVTRGFQFGASGNCGDIITATLQLQDGATNYGVVTYAIRLGTPVTTVSQNFDSVLPPALPSGWTAGIGSGLGIPWVTDSITPDSAPNSVFATTVPTVGDNQLVSAAMSIPSSDAKLNFRHRWNLEDGFDGGILEISINNGAFTDIIEAGGSFASGGYNGTISPNYSSPIAGQDAWTGDENDSYTTTTINLPAVALGKMAKFRWRLASDVGVSVSAAIWRIDSVSLTGNAYSCAGCPSAPAIINGPPPPTVVVGSPYSFAFNASGNPAPTFSVKGGTLPAGLSLSATGVLSGIVSANGGSTYPNILIAADNGNPPAAQTNFNLTTVTRASTYLGIYGLSGSNANLLYDYDHDGISNLAEYGLGLNPVVANISGLPIISMKKYGSAYYLSIMFHRSAGATDLTYTVQSSGDLVTWTDVASSVGGAQTSGSGFVAETGLAPNLTVEVRDTVPYTGAAGGRRFLRLKFSSP
ncbi:MAG TPA: zinc-dependent metalloprotease family protein [Chthoniobacterales bacterium]